MKSKLTGLLVLLGLVLLPGVALAQTSTPEIDELTIELWPEYDQPEVLVIYRLSLSDNTSLPATLTLPLPAHIDTPHAIAVERNGGLFSLEPEYIVQNKTADGLTLTLTVDSPRLQLEYYDPQLLAKQEQQRQLAFAYTAGYPVNVARFQVQQPLQATDFTMTPTPTGSFTDQNGLSYKILEIAGLAAGDSVQLSAAYTRSTNQPSAELLASQTPPGGQAADIQVVTGDGPTNWQVPWAYLLIGLGVLLLLATGGYWWWSNRPTAEPPAPAPVMRPARAKKRPTPRSQTTTGPASDGYCHQCGTALRADSKFCHVCGAPRRIG